MTFRLLGALLLVFASLLGGCSAYQLGKPTELPFRTLFVELIQDTSSTAQIRPLLTAALIQELNRSGRVEVVNARSAAEAILSMTLVEVERDPSVASPDDTGRPLKLERRFVAEVTLTDAAGRRLWLDRTPIAVERFVLITPFEGLSNAEAGELPGVARDLATATARSVLFPW